ncbi:hypothetical protein ACFO3D_13060 [Virgibacillus kekensis]|uniref:DUF4203 domain-containing protein n=1 Tax=Virgibacillus kekensis TaxID=202261 RepID=A0ABV9DK74_9BACI
MISYSIAVIIINLLVLFYFMGRNKNHQQSPLFHTLIMAMGMGYGFGYGVIAAVIFPGSLSIALFSSSATALLTGILIGKFTGDTGQIECMMEGLMGALMGAMLLFMLSDGTMFIVLTLSALTAFTIYFIRLILNEKENKLNNIQDLALYILMCISIVFIFSTFPANDQNHSPDEHAYHKIPPLTVGFNLIFYPVF